MHPEQQLRRNIEPSVCTGGRVAMEARTTTFSILISKRGKRQRESPLGLYGWDLNVVCLNHMSISVPANTLEGVDATALKQCRKVAGAKHTLVS